MNESAMTRTLLGVIRKAEPSWFVWKITETVTGGKPDALIIARQEPADTTWIEFKKCTSLTNPNPLAQLTELQKMTIKHLVQLQQRVFVVGYVGSWQRVVLYHAFITTHEPTPQLRFEEFSMIGEKTPAGHTPRGVHPLLRYLRGEATTNWRPSVAA